MRIDLGAEIEHHGFVWTVDALRPDGCVLSRSTPTGETITESVTWVDIVTDDGLVLRLLRHADAPAVQHVPAGEDLGYVAARLRAVNLARTGFQLGHAAMALPGEPRTRLSPVALGQSAAIMPRCEELARQLRVATPHSDPHLYALREGLPRTPRRTDTEADARAAAVSAVTLYRYVRAFESAQGNPAALVDRRGAWARTASERRSATKVLVEEVVFGDRPTDSRVSDAHVAGQVVKLATERGIAILGRSELDQMVGRLRTSWGRTPKQKKTAAMDRGRLGRASRRPTLPGEALCLDFSPCDVRVVNDDGTTPVRMRVCAAIDAATGAIMGLTVSGHERGEEVITCLRDAMRPLVFDDAGLPATEARLRPIPRLVALGDEAIQVLRPFEGTPQVKPGMIPSALRTDNARANKSTLILSQLALLGVDLRPSRVGHSMSNSQAEGVFNALNAFMESQPGYVGRNTRERGVDVPASELLTVSVLRRRLQAEHHALLSQRERSYTIEPGVTVSMSPLQMWDRLCGIYGYQPIMNAAALLFPTMHQRVGVLSRSGIRHANQRFDSDRLRAAFPLNGTRVPFWHDRRTLAHIWVRHPDTQQYLRVPNVLTDLTDRPLVEELLTIGTRRSGQFTDRGLSGLQLLARAIDQVMAERADGVAFGVSLETDLLDHQVLTRVEAEAADATGDLVLPDVPGRTEGAGPRYLPYATTAGAVR